MESISGIINLVLKAVALGVGVEMQKRILILSLAVFILAFAGACVVTP